MKQPTAPKAQRKLGLLLLSLLPATALGACSSTMPSAELTNARAAYQRAQNSQAASLVPADLYRAQRALQRAELAHDDDPGSLDERSFAYMAQREAEIAMTNASQAAAMQQIAQTQKRYTETQVRLRERAQAEAAASSVALIHARAELEDLQTQLQNISTVKAEPRGLVITIDGAVLFAFGESTLLPTARDKLKRVAEVLQKQDPKRPILVEGHTDSVGSDEANLRLSQARADAVKSFLVEHGVAAERVTAQGKGESQPLTSNDTPEGRANNRRVEIVVASNGAAGAPDSSNGAPAPSGQPPPSD